MQGQNEEEQQDMTGFYEQKISSLIQNRKKLIQDIQEYLHSNNVYFLQSFKVSDSLVQYVDQKDYANIFLRNVLIFSKFLGNSLSIPNSPLKLNHLFNLSQEYEHLTLENLNFLPKRRIKEVFQHVYDTKKENQPRLFVEEAKKCQLLDQMNYQTIIDGACTVLNHVYITFGEKDFYTKENYDLIFKIDNLIYTYFFKICLEIFHDTSSVLIKDEFTKINDLLFNSEQITQKNNINQLINQLNSKF